MAPAGWAAIGVGALGAGLGAWLYVAALGDKSDLEAEAAKRTLANTVSPGLYQDEFESRKAAIDSGLMTGGVLIGVGVAALGAGLTLIAVAPEATNVALLLHGDGGSARFCWHF